MVKAKKAQQSIAVTWARELIKAAGPEEAVLDRDGSVVVGMAVELLVLTWPSAGNHLSCATLDDVLPDGFPSSKPGAIAAMPDDTSSLRLAVAVWRSVLG